MKTRFTTLPDNLKIAYDCNGTGPAIVLLHGGGSERQMWHKAGYVDRLQGNFKVITLDLRGHGESDRPINPADYSTDKMGQDILAVADRCGVENFIIWGMSFGGNVSRYLAVQSERVEKIILMGVKLGTGVPDEIRQDIERFCEHWSPILRDQSKGTLNPELLSQKDRDFMDRFKVPVMMAWGQAMLDWQTVEPIDFRCPTLWLVGSEDQLAMNSVKEYKQSLSDSRVQLHIVDGLNHKDVFSEIDKVFPTMLNFTQSM